MTDSKLTDGVATAGPSTLLDMLRDVTSEYHRQLEAAIDWMAAFQSYETYRNLLERFARVVPPLELAIAQQLASPPPPEFDSTVRTRWLQSDLAAMASLIAASEPIDARQRATAAAACDDASTSSLALSAREFAYIDNAASAVGALYVLEGSSLGGQFLARQLHERLQLTPAQGDAYFVGYGAATGRRWQAFRQWANQQLASPRSTDVAAQAAKQTFVRFGKALAGLAYG